jgi:AAA family ATP:ADP antiporter
LHPAHDLSHRRESKRAVGKKAEEAEKPLGKEGGFQLQMKDRYLRLIALLILLLNLVNTIGEFLLGKFVENEAVRLIGAGDQFQAQRAEPHRRLLRGLLFVDEPSRGRDSDVPGLAHFQLVGVRGASRAAVDIPSPATLRSRLCRCSFVRLTKIIENATDYSR